MNYKRTIIGVLSIFLLLTSMIYCFQNYDNNNPQIKKYKQIFENPENFNNTEISFFAKIIAINKTTQTLKVSIQEEPYIYPSVEIKTGSLNIQNLKKGDFIDIIGILHGKNQISATQIWLNEPWKTDLIYLRSLPAIPFVLYLFFRTWKFNIVTWRFDRRKKNA